MLIYFLDKPITLICLVPEALKKEMNRSFPIYTKPRTFMLSQCPPKDQQFVSSHHLVINQLLDGFQSYVANIAI